MDHVQMIRIDVNIHKQLKVQAAAESITIKELAEKAILEYCEKRQKRENKK